MVNFSENCGLFGVYSDRNCIDDLYYGIFKLQHRGQRYCGLATFRNGIKLTTHKGFVRHTFNPLELKELSGRYGIGHVSLSERQPVFAESKLGSFSVAFSGRILNAEKLFRELKNQGHIFSGYTQVELISKLVVQAKDFVQGLELLARKVKGSYTVLILTKQGIYAARDPLGFKPFIIGKNSRGYAVSSESRPFNLLEYRIVRDVKPGEILLLNENGITTKSVVSRGRIALCAFEWGYIAAADSIIDGVPVVRVRKNLGRSLARGDRVKADIVAPVPFSGIGYALGYHQESGVPYDEAFLIDRFAGRSYLPLNQRERDLEAKIKLSVVEDSVRGKRIVLCDDSIVRGTQIRNKVLELKSFGVKEVHVRIGCPPLKAPCRYDLATRSYKELAARQHTIPEIARLIGADTLKYSSQDNLVKAVGLPEKDLCLACWSDKGVIREAE